MNEKMLVVPYDRNYFQEKIKKTYLDLQSNIGEVRNLFVSFHEFQSETSQKTLSYFSDLHKRIVVLYRQIDELVQMETMIFAEDAENHLLSLQQGATNVDQDLENPEV